MQRRHQYPAVRPRLLLRLATYSAAAGASSGSPPSPPPPPPPPPPALRHRRFVTGTSNCAAACCTNSRSRKKTWHEPKSELDTYLDDEFVNISENFEVLTWWKQIAEKCPVLLAMACDFLAIPLSNVSLESAFSCGGRILGDTRSSFTPKMLEALVCGKDWLIKVPNSEGQSSAT